MSFLATFTNSLMWPHEKKGSGNFHCSRLLHRNSFTHNAQDLRLHNYLEKTDTSTKPYNIYTHIKTTDKAAARVFTVNLNLVISYWSWDLSTHVTEYCAVIGCCTEWHETNYY